MHISSVWKKKGMNVTTLDRRLARSDLSPWSLAHPTSQAPVSQRTKRLFAHIADGAVLAAVAMQGLVTHGQSWQPDIGWLIYLNMPVWSIKFCHRSLLAVNQRHVSNKSQKLRKGGVPWWGLCCAWENLKLNLRKTLCFVGESSHSASFKTLLVQFVQEMIK